MSVCPLWKWGMCDTSTRERSGHAGRTVPGDFSWLWAVKLSLRNTLKQTNSANSGTRRMCLNKKGSWSAPQIVLGNYIWNGSMNQST